MSCIRRIDTAWRRLLWKAFITEKALPGHVSGAGSVESPTDGQPIIAYVPLTVLAIPASILTLGGGYLFGLPLGVVADSVGATIGATAAFLIGRTVSSSTPAHIIFLLRLVPLLPFNILNYLLSVTPVHTGKYMLASWLGMMPSTFSLVYVGTTLKDLSDVTHGWNEISATRWDVACHPYWFYKLHFLVDVGFPLKLLLGYVDVLTFSICCCFNIVILMVCVAKVAKASLDKSLIENGEKCIMGQSMLPAGPESPLDL
ncbi:SNARE associated Golgi protein family [Citrus sinensis]|nr:SNARE associated Golgi protein family [Citrus sinensis]